MRRLNFPGLLLFFLFNGLVSLTHGQSNSTIVSIEKKTAEPKPYKILTHGKKITIQSQQNLKSVLVWTASGHRIVEQKKIASLSFSFWINAKENIFFIMVEMENGNRYTSKLGVN